MEEEEVDVQCREAQRAEQKRSLALFLHHSILLALSRNLFHLFIYLIIVKFSLHLPFKFLAMSRFFLSLNFSPYAV